MSRGWIAGSILADAAPWLFGAGILALFAWAGLRDADADERARTDPALCKDAVVSVATGDRVECWHVRHRVRVLGQPTLGTTVVVCECAIGGDR